jgi:hypothetical protein
MKLNQYQPRVYSNLPDFHIAENLSEDKKKLLPILGDVICKFNLEDNIGICLLHKHFNLKENEMLVRTFENNSFDIEPKSNYSAKVLPYMWAFSQSGLDKETALYPVEFIEKRSESTDFGLAVKEVQENEQFVEALKTALIQNELTNIFGISLIPHKLFDIKSDETLIENDVEGQKKLHISVVPSKTLLGQKTAQTLWKFNKNGFSDEKLDCIIHCGLHCGIHCGIHD